MKGIILRKGEENVRPDGSKGPQFYTFMKKQVFDSIHNVQRDYNWLISNIDAFPCDKFYEFFKAPYIWISGGELTEIFEEHDFQWMFAVFSGFTKDITKEEVLQYELPYADCYEGFWKNPLTIQHPLAVIEIAPFDCSYVLLISSDDKIVENFVKSKPLAEDLETYNNSLDKS